jgi:hypothetical protein
VFVALACAEAMEHNAVVSKEEKSIGENIKRLVSDSEYERLVYEHQSLETPITEPIAELAFHLSMGTIEDKCHAPTESVDKLIKMFNDSLEAHKKKKFGAAQQGFIEVKSKLLDIAHDLCKT